MKKILLILICFIYNLVSHSTADSSSPSECSPFKDATLKFSLTPSAYRENLFGQFSINCSFAITTKEILNRAETASTKEERLSYIKQARKIYEEAYKENPLNTEALIGLSKTYQLTQNRRKAKLYISMAYNTDPSSAVLQREMGDFFYSFQEYTTAIEYYKLALASGLLKDFETNMQTAKCYEKLGDNQNAELYYKISNYINPESKEAVRKINAYESSHHQDNTQELENAKYKYLFKEKPLSEKEQTLKDTEDIIEQLNRSY